MFPEVRVEHQYEVPTKDRREALTAGKRLCSEVDR